MDINGRLDMQSYGEPPVLSGVAAATATGNDGQDKQGVLKFSNGFKIQWNTVDVDADTATDFTLPSAYTEAHYGVLASYNETRSLTVNQSSVHAAVSVSPNNLTSVNLYQIAGAAGTFAYVTYVSWGKDLA